jgi:glutamine amidotransferase
MVLTTADELWALRYPATNELYILERSVGGIDPGAGFDERSASGTMRVRAGELSFLPATVIASERMNANLEWRLLESGELIHVDPELRVTSTIAVPDPPVHMIDLSTMSAQAAIAQGEEPGAAA